MGFDSNKNRIHNIEKSDYVIIKLSCIIINVTNSSEILEINTISISGTVCLNNYTSKCGTSIFVKFECGYCTFLAYVLMLRNFARLKVNFSYFLYNIFTFLKVTNQNLDWVKMEHITFLTG